ncbi:hypothetical protein A2924_00160 [Candidatus Giovannonibacteria bacterium RIFCSPLOWO2_01_FULL_44_16]|uniref:FAD/NAD(P)-binding domain-containing protein n=1 Tax=Candidatus Giovannonibacteria bacterium RIFCSPLOWO2_01_FULL_44_16 TaxID=1798348 RepID=A0A1F5X437_9BACT|nr:MAG: hypothetical protein A2924_00160 [Candidatus Giovannonibacteria bacterium RIFCSPLOWO2_01_FULL_44_16]
MPQVDYLIIGGGIAGTTCAETLRSKDISATIAILDAEKQSLYSKVLIPAYLKGKAAREKLFLRNISQYQSQNIDLYSETVVAAVDTVKKEVLTHDNKQFAYKKLLIASGGIPKKINEIFSSTTPIEPLVMRNIEDMDAIKAVIDGRMQNGNSSRGGQQEKVLVVGESFIALEFLEIFSMRGFEVHMLARGKYWGGEEKFGDEGGRIMEDNFIRHGAVIHRNAEINFIKNDDFYLKNGEHIKMPIWALGIGLMRNFSFLPDAVKNTGLLCDEYLRTSEPDIFAAGDAAEYFDISLQRRVVAGNWTNAFLQGRCAAINMLSADGAAQAFKAVPTYTLVNLGINLTFLGMIGCDTADDTFELSDENRLMRVFLEKGKATGAVLINRFNDKITLSKLIENGHGREELEKLFKQSIGE